MASAKAKMLGYLLDHVREFVPIGRLREVSGGVSDWARSLRTLRQEGWKLESVRSPSYGYILHSATKGEGNERGYINKRLRFQILERDKVCQRCGRGPKDRVKLVIDHIIPVDPPWNGKTEPSNLQALCEECNTGKKNFVAINPADVIGEVLAKKSGYQRLLAFLGLHPNEDIPYDILETVSGIRDWERTIRLIRAKERMRIRTFRKRDGVWYYRHEL